MSTTADLLAGHPMFGGFSAALLDELAAGSEEHVLAQDERLFRTGQEARRFYLVRSGRIALDLLTAGGRVLTVDTLGPGQLVGLSWLVPPYRWYLDARAVEPSAVVSVDAALVRSRCDADPVLGYPLMRQVTQDLYARMQSARVRLLDVYGRPDAG